MERSQPRRPVYQAGTLSGNPLAMAAGLATLEILRKPGSYESLENRSATLAQGLQVGGRKTPASADAVNRVGSMLSPSSSSAPARKSTNYAEATACDTKAFALSSTPCSKPASTSPRANSRPSSSASPTPNKSSSKPFLPPGKQ